jgi:dephospho-CoA kinase
MTKIVGLTGGIGSGKSTVASFFRKAGIPVYIADEAARKLMDSPQILALIRQSFGDAVFAGDTLDRNALASIVFGDPDKLRTLNQIVHPAVARHFADWVASHENAPLVIKEAAVLFESGSYKDCDSIITVTAPVETRIERVMKRDGASRESVLKRVENQWDDAKKIALSDFVIHNTNLPETTSQVAEILKKLQIF